MHLYPQSAWNYAWGCTPYVLILHHRDAEYDYTLPEVGKGARHSVPDCQLRFRFLGKERYRKASVLLFSPDQFATALLNISVAARTHLFSETGLWKDRPALSACSHEVAMHFVCHTPFLLLSEACAWRYEREAILWSWTA